MSFTAAARPLPRNRYATLFTLCALFVVPVYSLPAQAHSGPDGDAESHRSVVLRDVTGGNERLHEIEVAEDGEPTPLPNPAVFQGEEQAPTSRTLTITLPAEHQTEVKLLLPEGKVALFSWTVDQGTVYVDMHGHDDAFGPDFFVRYREADEATAGYGSLTAPFTGEHGWFWLNYNEFPVTITLTVTGYFEDVVEYELSQN